jgi:hypothetical protein
MTHKGLAPPRVYPVFIASIYLTLLCNRVYFPHPTYTPFPELQSLPLLTNLIERTGLRPKYTTNSLERYSLEIRSLAELVDMFYTRQATNPRDKVYALLGISSDDPSKAGLQPDYTITWEELF